MKINQAFLFLATTFADRLAKSDVYELLQIILKRSYAEIVLGVDDFLLLTGVRRGFSLEEMGVLGEVGATGG